MYIKIKTPKYGTPAQKWRILFLEFVENTRINFHQVV